MMNTWEGEVQEVRKKVLEEFDRKMERGKKNTSQRYQKNLLANKTWFKKTNQKRESDFYQYPQARPWGRRWPRRCAQGCQGGGAVPEPSGKDVCCIHISHCSAPTLDEVCIRTGAQGRSCRAKYSEPQIPEGGDHLLREATDRVAHPEVAHEAEGAWVVGDELLSHDEEAVNDWPITRRVQH